MLIFVLLAKLDKLSTKDGVSRWNSKIDCKCLLCLNHSEDRDHLYFKCSYSRQLLDIISRKLKINFGNSYDLNQILENICLNQNNQSLLNHIINIIFTTLFWNIWSKRNSRVFNNINLPMVVRLKLLFQDCKTLVQHFLGSNKSSPEIKLILNELEIDTGPSAIHQPP